MKTKDDLESYMLRMGLGHEAVGEGLWKLSDDGFSNLMVSLTGPVVVFRLKVMDLPTGRREELFEALLRLNATEMLHGAFGLEGTAIIIGAALPIENLDFNEFQSVVDDIGMAVGKHHSLLSKFRS